MPNTMTVRITRCQSSPRGLLGKPELGGEHEREGEADGQATQRGEAEQEAGDPGRPSGERARMAASSSRTAPTWAKYQADPPIAVYQNTVPNANTARQGEAVAVSRGQAGAAGATCSPTANTRVDRAVDLGREARAEQRDERQSQDRRHRRVRHEPLARAGRDQLVEPRGSLVEPDPAMEERIREAVEVVDRLRVTLGGEQVHAHREQQTATKPASSGHASTLDAYAARYVERR